MSDEWEDRDRLQVFPAPLLHPATPRTGGTPAQAGRIGPDKPVRDIQDCDS